MAPSRKRQRTNTDGDTIPGEPSASLLSQALASTPQFDVSRCIDELDAADGGALIKDIVLNLAKQQPYVANVIRVAYHKHNQAKRNLSEHENNIIRQFEEVSSVLAPIFIGNYDTVEQRKIATRIARKVTKLTQEIIKKAGKPSASFNIKSSGLESLCKICDALVTSQNSLARRVRKKFQPHSSLQDAMVVIVEAMSEQERQKMCGVYDGESNFLQKIEELKVVADTRGCFRDLEAVIEALAGERQDSADEIIVIDDSTDEDEDDEVESCTRTARSRHARASKVTESDLSEDETGTSNNNTAHIHTDFTSDDMDHDDTDAINIRDFAEEATLSHNEDDDDWGEGDGLCPQLGARMAMQLYNKCFDEFGEEMTDPMSQSILAKYRR